MHGVANVHLILPILFFKDAVSCFLKQKLQVDSFPAWLLSRITPSLLREERGRVGVHREGTSQGQTVLMGVEAVSFRVQLIVADMTGGGRGGGGVGVGNDTEQRSA